MPIEAEQLPPQAPPAGTGNQSQGGVTPANQNRGEPRKQGPGTEWFDRIQELTRKAAKAEAEWDKKEAAYTEELQAMRSRLEALEKPQNGNRSAEPPDGKPFRSWDEVPDAYISKVLREGQGENPDAWTMALEEKLKRATDGAIKSATRVQDEKAIRSAHVAASWQDMVKTYGPELDVKESPLRIRAEELMLEKIRNAKRLGFQDPRGNPEAEEACVARAFTELHTVDRDEVHRLRRDAERVRQIEALESGSRSARKAVDDEAGRLLKEGKIGDSLRSLPLMKGIRERFPE